MGWIKSDEKNYEYIGLISQFGYSGSNRRSMVVTTNPGVTGVTGDSGWYLSLDKGAPDAIFLNCTQVPRTPDAWTYIYFAIRYPANAVFTVTKQGGWGDATPQVSLTKVTSFAELKADTTYNKYAFVVDGSEGWLVVKVQNKLFQDQAQTWWPDWHDFYYEVNGVRVYDSMAWSYWYRVDVTGCSGCTKSNGFYAVSDKVPPAL